MQGQRDQWTSRVGFILAAAGSAVGLGNIWRFPYMAGANGGSAFIIIYLAFVFTIGLSVMIAEFAVGRKTGLAAVGAFKSINPNWTFAGVLGVLSGFLIMGFYPVVGGWALAYVFKSFTGLLSDGGAIGAAFGAFIGNPWQPLLWMALYMVLNIVIVARGISSGIEKAGKILMPALFIMLILLALRSLTLPHAMGGLEFLFKPDFSKVTGATFLAALGQAFFSLSLGMGCMITYGSYLKKDQKLPNNAVIVTTLDTVVALLAGIAIFPALFAFGIEPTAGPGLVFVVVPSVFAQMGFLGIILSIIFFISLTVAALTSSVSLLEVVVAYLIDQKKVERKKAVFLTSLVMILLCVFASLSLGIWAEKPIPFFGVGAFDMFDILTDKIFLAIGGLLLAIFVGWFMKKSELEAELSNEGSLKFGAFNIWYYFTKYVVPLAIAIVALLGISSMSDNSALVSLGQLFAWFLGLPALMIFGLVIIAISAAYSRKL